MELDLNLYNIYQDIPIFDEDEEHDEAYLQEICRVNNDRILDTGEYVPLSLGHTLDGVPEIEQPDNVGFAWNFHITTIGNLHPRKTVSCTFGIEKDKQEIVKDYKTRSVELWEQDKVIYPIALLKNARPAKQLGVMQYSKENQTKLIKYSYEEGDEMDRDTITQLVVDTINQSELAAAIKNCQEELAKLTLIKQKENEPELPTAEEGKEEVGEEGAEETGEEASEADESERIAKDAEKEGEEHPELPKEDIEQIAEDHVKADEADPTKNEEGAMPSGSDTFQPGFDKKKKEKDLDDEETEVEDKDENPDKKKKHEAEGEVIRYQEELKVKEVIVSKYQEQFKILENEKNEAVRRYQIAQREITLTQLSNEFNFNTEAELKLVEKMDDQAFLNHCEIIKTRYAKAPIGRAIINPVKEVADNKISEEKVLEIVRYASKHNMSFEQAKKEVMN